MEKLALEKYPPHFIWDDDEKYDCNIESREIFIDGYKSAQKELLTKEDLYNCLGHFAYKYGITINGNDIDKWIKNLER